MSRFCGVISILGVGQASAFPLFAVQRSCSSASHLFMKEKKCYLSLDDSCTYENVKQNSATKISQRCGCEPIKCKRRNPDNGCGLEKKDVSQATLLWSAIKLPIYSVAVVPLAINENLSKNQEIWKAKIQEIEEREEKALRLKDDKIRDLEEQLKDLMLHLEAGQAVEQSSISDEVKDGSVLKIGGESSTTGANKSKNRKKSK